MKLDQFLMIIRHSKYLTIPVQKVNIVSLIAQGLIVIMLYYNSSLTIANFSAVIIFCNLGFVISTYRIFRKHKVVGIPPINPEIKPYIKLTKEIYNFSHPLLTLALFTSLVMVFFDRWYLQMQSGSIEQGFFHFASYTLHTHTAVQWSNNTNSSKKN